MTTFYEPTPDELSHLRRCVELARIAWEDGDEPFGSVLVDPEGRVLFEDRNRIKGGDATRHPEFEIARWAAEHLSPGQRVASTVFTSGEHCPMCAAAHAWAGLGRIVYVASSAQLGQWLDSWGVAAPPVRGLPITTVAPSIEVAGPDEQLAQEVRLLHARYHGIDPSEGAQH